MRRAQNTVKRGSFWPDRVVCGWGGGPSLLRRGEKRRTAMPRPGAPGRIKGLRPLPPTPGSFAWGGERGAEPWILSHAAHVNANGLGLRVDLFPMKLLVVWRCWKMSRL